MSEKHSYIKSETDWERLENMSDEDIDYSDIPPLTEEQLKAMRPTSEVLAEKGIKFEQKPGPHLVTVNYKDGSKRTYFIEPQRVPIYLLPDVQKYFPDSAAVNKALRTLITLFPDKQPESAD